jgi:hypothetical protein
MIVAEISVKNRAFTMTFDSFASAHEYVRNAAKMFGPQSVSMISSQKVSADEVDDIEMA